MKAVDFRLSQGRAGLLASFCIVIVAVGVFGLIAAVVLAPRTAPNPPKQESEYRQLALNEIRRYASILRIDPDKLPTLVGRQIEDGFDYTIEDSAQNILIHVQVNHAGAVELGSAPLDQVRDMEADVRSRFRFEKPPTPTPQS